MQLGQCFSPTEKILDTAITLVMSSQNGAPENTASPESLSRFDSPLGSVHYKSWAAEGIYRLFYGPHQNGCR